jgi:hypothetical protein
MFFARLDESGECRRVRRASGRAIARGLATNPQLSSRLQALRRTGLVVEAEGCAVAHAAVAMELLIGCRNRAEIQHRQNFLNTFLIWPDASECARAYELLAMPYANGLRPDRTAPEATSRRRIRCLSG